MATHIHKTHSPWILLRHCIKIIILPTVLLLANRDDVLAHEAGTRKELVHEIAIAKLTVIISIVGHAIPWLNTHKRSMLATRAPDADSRCLEIYGNDRLVALTKQFHMVKLAVIEDDRIILECVLCNIPNTFVRLHFLVTALVNTPLYITEDADRALIIEPLTLLSWVRRLLHPEH